MLDRLEKREIIVRVPDKKDGRQKLIHLTKKGKDLEEKLEPLNEENIASSQKDISADRLKECRAVLQNIYENLLN